MKEINETEYHEILINHTTPYSPFDILENKSLLLENNFDNLNAIDWDKGCYVGQEITARMKYRGLLKKKLYALKIKSGDVLEGDELIVDNKKIGTIVSKANSKIFAAFATKVAEELEKGSTLPEILDHEERFFNTFDKTLIKSCWRTGRLSEGFSQLYDHHKKRL